MHLNFLQNKINQNDYFDYYHNLVGNLEIELEENSWATGYRIYGYRAIHSPSEKSSNEYSINIKQDYGLKAYVIHKTGAENNKTEYAIKRVESKFVNMGREIHLTIDQIPAKKLLTIKGLLNRGLRDYIGHGEGCDETGHRITIYLKAKEIEAIVNVMNANKKIKIFMEFRHICLDNLEKRKELLGQYIPGCENSWFFNKVEYRITKLEVL